MKNTNVGERELEKEDDVLDHSERFFFQRSQSSKQVVHQVGGAHQYPGEPENEKNDSEVAFAGVLFGLRQ